MTLTIAAVIILAGLGIMHGKVLRLEYIELIVDNIPVEDTQFITNICNIKIGQNIFSVNKEKIQNALTQLGTYSIENVNILYPNTVKIQLSTRIPAAIIEYNSNYIIVDKNCHVIKMIDTIEEYELPIFVGIRISQYQLGTQLITKDPYQKSLIETIINTLIENNTTEIVHTVSLENLSDIYIVAPNGKKINLCEAVDVPDKIRLLSEKKLQDAIFDDIEHNITLYKNYFAIS